MNFKTIKQRLLNSKMFKDSFWAVFGNAVGNVLLLIAGILIARLLGKDVYGEYGVVKTTMFYVASFATFGIGFSSTRYISKYSIENPQFLKCIIRDSTRITIFFSSTIAILLFIFSKDLADYVNEPSLKVAFQALAIIIVFKAITTTQIGLLAGFKCFEKVALNSVFSGFFMIVICVPLTYFWGLKGSLLSLLMSQAFNAFINLLTIRKYTSQLTNQEEKDFKKEILKFSFPIALQESSYSICNWMAIILLTKYSSAGELALYTASAQWNAVILLIPSKLSNVILSYLSGTTKAVEQHNRILHRMLAVNFICTVIPFLIVLFLANIISGFYGKTFFDLPSVLRIITLCTIFEACSTVFKSELMAQGKTWTLFTLRCMRDLFLLGGVYILLQYTQGINGALSFAYMSVATSALFFVAMYIACRVSKH